MMADRTVGKILVGAIALACCLVSLFVGWVEFWSEIVSVILAVVLLMALAGGFLRWYYARKQFLLKVHAEREELTTLATNARDSARYLVERVFPRKLVIDSNIWMDPEADAFFVGLESLLASTGKILEIPAEQYEEIQRIKDRTNFGEPANTRARLAQGRIERLQAVGCLRIPSVSLVARPGAYVDPLLIQIAVEAASTGERLTLMTDDRDVRIRAREHMRGRPYESEVFIASWQDVKNAVTWVRAAQSRGLTWPSFAGNVTSAVPLPPAFWEHCLGTLRLPQVTRFLRRWLGPRSSRLPARSWPRRALSTAVTLLLVATVVHLLLEPWLARSCADSQIQKSLVLDRVPHEVTRGLIFKETVIEYGWEYVDGYRLIPHQRPYLVWRIEGVITVVVAGTMEMLVRRRRVPHR